MDNCSEVSAILRRAGKCPEVDAQAEAWHAAEIMENLEALCRLELSQ